MILILINNNRVVNIVQADPDALSTFTPFFQFVVDGTNLNPRPLIGYTYNGVSFSPSSLDLIDNQIYASSTSSGIISSSIFSIFNSKIGSVLYLPTTPNRALNTNFTPSSTSAVMVIYSITITSVAAVASGQTGSVELLSDINPVPVTVRCSVSNTNSITLGVGIGISNSQRGQVAYLVPPGHSVRLSSTGTSTISITNQLEIELRFNT